MEQRKVRLKFFGHFGHGNFGNESTFHAILYHLRRFVPEVEIACICTGPAATAELHKIPTVPVSRTISRAWKPHNPFGRLLRSAFVGLPDEVYRWVEGFMMLKGTDALLVPGTGLLTDAYGLKSWGPYSLFKWSVLAKMRGCKLLFVSVGAGPLSSRAGRWLVRSALALADFRSYRDTATRDYLRSLGVQTATDRVYPDLAFSISDELTRGAVIPKRRRSVVGIGLMLYHGKLSSDGRADATYTAYLEQLAVFVGWLLGRRYDVRLLIGELSDETVVTEFQKLLRARMEAYDQDRIIAEPIRSAQDLLAQLGETDAVVATRFHNILLALALNKPVMSISFHPKCTSLMQDMGLKEYCQDIKQLRAERLIAQFCHLEKNAITLREIIREKVGERRQALDEQYRLIFTEVMAHSGA